MTGVCAVCGCWPGSPHAHRLHRHVELAQRRADVVARGNVTDVPAGLAELARLPLPHGLVAVLYRATNDHDAETAER
jgi:hypothetical protein